MVDTLKSPALCGLLLLLVLAGCGGGADRQAAEARGSGAGGDDGVERLSANPTGEKAPQFQLPSIDGSTFDLAQQTAGKVTLIDFWATWCAPCREEIPMFKELVAQYGDRGFSMVAISEESADVIAEFAEEYEISYTNLVEAEDVQEQYGVLALPSAYLVGRDGKIAKFFMGPKPRKVLEKAIQELLEQEPAT